MHELPVTQGILSAALETARRHRAERITDIFLVIGNLSSIVDDSVQFYFDILSRETIAAGATLHFQREKAIARCLTCKHEFEAQPPLSPQCPQCKNLTVRVSGGQKFFIESIEVEP